MRLFANSEEDIFNVGIRLLGLANIFFISDGFYGYGYYTGEVIRGFEFDFSLAFV